MRDHLIAHIDRWATRAVDDADNRRRAERFLAWAERPEQVQAAQRRGLFAGMDADQLRRLADTRVRGPVTPETALDVWTQVEDCAPWCKNAWVTTCWRSGGARLETPEPSATASSAQAATAISVGAGSRGARRTTGWAVAY